MVDLTISPLLEENPHNVTVDVNKSDEDYFTPKESENDDEVPRPILLKRSKSTGALKHLKSRETVIEVAILESRKALAWLKEEGKKKDEPYTACNRIYLASLIPFVNLHKAVLSKIEAEYAPLHFYISKLQEPELNEYTQILTNYWLALKDAHCDEKGLQYIKEGLNKVLFKYHRHILV